MTIPTTIALDPVDWFFAPWRNPDPLPRPEPPPFDPEETKKRLARLGSTPGWPVRWNMAALDIPQVMSKPEAQFWLHLMMNRDLIARPKQYVATLKDLSWPGELDPDFANKLIHRHEVIIPEIGAALAAFLTPERFADLLLEPPSKKKQANEHEHEWFRVLLAIGFTRHVLPYLPREERKALAERVRTALQKRNWDKPESVYHVPAVVVFSAFVGLHEDLEPLIAKIPDKFHRPQDGYHSFEYDRCPLLWLVCGLRDARTVGQHALRLRLTTPTGMHVRALLAASDFEALDIVCESMALHKRREEAEELMRVLMLARDAAAVPAFWRLRQDNRAAGLAREWLDEHPTLAVAGLLPLASKERGVVEYLRDFKKQGHGTLIEMELEKRPETEQADIRKSVLERVEKEYTPFDAATTPAWLREAVTASPVKGTLPKWVSLDRLPPLTIDSERLNDEQTKLLLLNLQKCGLDGSSPLIKAVRERVEGVIRDAFVWQLFECWMAYGAVPKEKWGLQALGQLGGDGAVLKLSPLLREWPAQRQHPRAVVGLECLRKIGSETALMQLNGIAGKIRFAGLKARAEQFMKEIAAEKGLTMLDLEDRVVPDLGLDEKGSRTFDYGTRQFRCVLHGLKPMVAGPDGKAKGELPKPGAKDDAEKAAVAVAEWKLLKKQLSEAIKAQAKRLEKAMTSCRRWTPAHFETYIVHHPLLLNLARLVVWGGYDDANGLVRTFRVTEDREYMDVQDRPATLEGVKKIGVVHRVQMKEPERVAWGEQFGDYELIQPFAQLERPVAELTPEEREADRIERHADRQLDYMVLTGVTKNTGFHEDRDANDYEGLYYVRTFEYANLTAVLRYKRSELKLDRAYFVKGLHEKAAKYDEKTAVKLKDVDPVALNEVLAIIEAIARKPVETE